MWLAIKESILKEAARKKQPPGDIPETEDELKPVDKLHINELGTQGAIHYRRLLGRFPSGRYPEAQIGPDETIEHHYSRLKGLLNDELASGQAELSRAREQGKLSPQTTYEETTSKPISQPWVGDLPTGNAPVSDLHGLPQRIPNQYTTGNPEFGTKPFSGWELPPADQPLHTGPRAPMPAPQQQSMQDWVNFLRGKGITLNHQLMRPDAVQMQGPMPQGQDIWSDFVGPTTPESYHQYLKDQPAGPNTFGKSWKQRAVDLIRGRRSSTIVNEYISGVLTGEVLPKLAEYDPVAAFWKRHNNMLAQDWKFHESGSGNYYEKNINGKTHRIMGDRHDGENGWTHQVNGRVSQFYPSLNEAVMAATTGTPLAGFALPQPARIPDSSHQPDRGERTREIGNMIPPDLGGKGRYQTYSSRWDEQ
jgi:hypothetical protein